MHRFSVQVVVTAVIVFGLAWSASAALGPYDPSRARGPIRPEFARPNSQNRVHDAGNMRMNITNYGYFGNAGPGQSDALFDPCPPHAWAPQCEFPKGSGVQYLFQGGLWIGALIVEQGFETKRVSTGTDGWLNPAINEFWPGEGADQGIKERSTRPGLTNCLGEYVSDSNAISDQDFICVYSDTLTQEPQVQKDPIDGKHRPLGIRVTQTSYALSQAFARDFILIDYEVENVASNFLKNLYVGLYVDADVGPMDRRDQHTDDICGFLTDTYEPNAQGDTVRVPINVAWIADNDGRDPRASTGPLICPDVAGTRVIRGPNPRLETSFNWWISNGDANLDYGPSWKAYADRDSLGMGWTQTFGTPMGDEKKYQVLSNREFDFWQVMVNQMSRVTPQSIDSTQEEWFDDQNLAQTYKDDIANGYDTRYLLSWGPLGVKDYQDQSGRWIYRLNPGEKFNMTIAYVCGQNFHDPNHPQPTNQVIDSSLFNFADLRTNARWAMDVYDNRMHDTPCFDSAGILVGDGWFGEDVGTDGLYADTPPGFRVKDCTDPTRPYDSVEVVYFKHTRWEVHAGWYTGPDCDQSERNGKIDPVSNPNLPATATSEDKIIPEDMTYTLPKLGFWDMGWMNGNGILDQGDGIPDFTGPPPPQIPALLHCVQNTTNAAAHFGGVVRVRPGSECYVGGLGYELQEDKIVLRWSKKASENPDYRDPFSRQQDFEGYRIHVSNVNQDEDYSLLAEFDQVDFGYYSATDSLMSYPVLKPAYDSLVAAGKLDSIFVGGIVGHLKPVGNNTGFDGIMMDDSTYQFVVDAHKLSPRYYAVTAFDYGDPRSGLGSLTTLPTTNAVLLAPAGSSSEPVRVVPNPYRAYEDYTHSQLGISWENMNDGTTDFYPQQDRRLEFINLPDKCLIRVFTVAGDLVQIIPHNIIGDKSQWASLTSERWDLNSRNKQQVVSGIYLFSVEDLTEGNGHKIETGKFVIIR